MFWSVNATQIPKNKCYIRWTMVVISMHSLLSLAECIITTIVPRIYHSVPRLLSFVPLRLPVYNRCPSDIDRFVLLVTRHKCSTITPQTKPMNALTLKCCKSRHMRQYNANIQFCPSFVLPAPDTVRRFAEYWNN